MNIALSPAWEIVTVDTSTAIYIAVLVLTVTISQAGNIYISSYFEIHWGYIDGCHLRRYLHNILCFMRLYGELCIPIYNIYYIVVIIWFACHCYQRYYYIIRDSESKDT